MADTSTTHLNLIKQDVNAAPDQSKENDNLDTLDSEIWARGKSFNGEPVGSDGGFHVNKIPYAENLDTASAQPGDGTFITRTTGGEASLTTGEAWIAVIRGTRRHDNYTPESLTWNVQEMPREEEEEEIYVTLDEAVFKEHVTQSGTISLIYTTVWSDDPTDYGFTVTGTPKAGDMIVAVFVKEVRGTIVHSNPQTFVSSNWNLYNHTNGYARLVKYSEEYMFKISGTWTSLQFSETVDGSRIYITPSQNGLFAIPSDGYVFVVGGNSTNTAIWMTWSDWEDGYQGSFVPHQEYVVNLTTFMSSNFPYGLLQVGTVQDEINLNVGVATSYIERMSYNATNLANAIASGRQYEYDENYIYLERSTPVTYNLSIDGSYTADDHGMEWFTGTTQEVFAQTMYGSNLRNKLERDVVTKSQDLANNLTTTAAGKALDARQGKTLNTSITTLKTNIKSNLDTAFKITSHERTYSVAASSYTSVKTNEFSPAVADQSGYTLVGCVYITTGASNVIPYKIVPTISSGADVVGLKNVSTSAQNSKVLKIKLLWMKTKLASAITL